MKDPQRVMFIGYEWSLDEYDDQLAARAYAAKFFYFRLSPLERRALIEAGPIISSSEHPIAQKVYAFMEERDGHVDDEALVSIYNSDRRGFIDSVCDRLVATYCDEINRCLRCDRVLRTWSAVRCPWCNASWTRKDILVPRRNPRPEPDSDGKPKHN